ncbi:MAG: potassium-transporting ATPase subunit C [Luteolibacter sp.]
MLVIAVIAIGWIKYPMRHGVLPVSEREAIHAAESLLARKLSGPRYFNVPVAGIKEEGGPWIGAADARSQVPKITAERKLGPESAREIDRLIGQMTEPHPSRMVGGERINLLRLNLSLDSIKDQ